MEISRFPLLRFFFASTAEKPGKTPKNPANYFSWLRNLFCVSPSIRHLPKISLTRGERTFSVVSLEIPCKVLQKLGINANLYTIGAQLLVFRPNDFPCYLEFLGNKNPAWPAGVYGAEARDELALIRLNEEDCLPRAKRTVAVKSTTGALTLTHEILHDIFANPNLDNPKQFRSDFYRLVFEELAGIAQLPTKAAVFYGQIAEKCDGRYELSAIASFSSDLLKGGSLERQQALAAVSFADEVFAYGGTMAIGHKMDFPGVISDRLRNFFLNRSLPIVFPAS